MSSSGQSHQCHARLRVTEPWAKIHWATGQTFCIFPEFDCCNDYIFLCTILIVCILFFDQCKKSPGDQHKFKQSFYSTEKDHLVQWICAVLSTHVSFLPPYFFQLSQCILYFFFFFLLCVYQCQEIGLISFVCHQTFVFSTKPN